MADYLWWDNFLPGALIAQVRNVALSNQDKFVPTTVSTGDADYRRSAVLWHHNFIELYEAFCDRLGGFIPLVQQELGEHFEVGQIELHMTSSSNGDFFRVHNDNGSPDAANRRLTFVYYCLLREPQAFTGGQLMLEGTVIEPQHNSIIWFPSHLLHEILPVVSSGEFLDSRLTLNGWLRSAGA